MTVATQAEPYGLHEYRYINGGVSRERLANIHGILARIRDVPGDVAEVGVWRGGSSRLIAEVCPERTLYACDTFEGYPGGTKFEGVHGDLSDVDLERVKATVNCPNVEYVVGMFPESSTEEMASKRYAFAHFDAGTQQATLAFLAFFYERMSPGGVMVFDDFARKHTPGVADAIYRWPHTREYELRTHRHFQAELWVY